MSVPDSIVAAMRETNDIFVREVAAGRNVDALDRVYTADARILPPGSDVISGRENVKRYWREVIGKLNLKEAKLATVDAQLLGDGIAEIGRAELVAGDGRTMSVKYVVVWKQEDGRWKWMIDIWNPSA